MMKSEQIREESCSGKSPKSKAPEMMLETLMSTGACVTSGVE
jgi:hypothetical protein